MITQQSTALAQRNRCPRGRHPRLWRDIEKQVAEQLSEYLGAHEIDAPARSVPDFRGSIVLHDWIANWTQGFEVGAHSAILSTGH